jgi:hypothetical protein
MFRKGSLLAEGRNNRYGACAFFTLKGYAGRNQETEWAFSFIVRGDSPPSRFSSEFGTRADAKQYLGLVTPGWIFHLAVNSPTDLRAAGR